MLLRACLDASKSSLMLLTLREIGGRQSVLHSFLDTYAGVNQNFRREAISAETKLTD